MCGTFQLHGDLKTEITFDETTGDLTFDTNDHNTFPPGAYEYIITITIGSVSVNTNVVIILNDNCGSNEFTVITQPSETYFYHLSE
jgi:hypothetical protein